MTQNLMKKILIYLAIMSSTIIICFTLFVLISAIRHPISENVGQQINSEEKDYKYCVKDEEGKVTVYEKGNPDPIKILDTKTNLLPEYDRQMLSQGIYLDSVEKLNGLLEDYDD